VISLGLIKAHHYEEMAFSELTKAQTRASLALKIANLILTLKDRMNTPLQSLFLSNEKLSDPEADIVKTKRQIGHSIEKLKVTANLMNRVNLNMFNTNLELLTEEIFDQVVKEILDPSMNEK
jgi:hypothetical protein